MNKRQLYESIMRNVSRNVKKVLNEGAGAGYEIKFNDVNIAIESAEILKKDDDIVIWKAQIIPCTVDWAADSYYDSVSSDGIEYHSQLVKEYNEEDRRINGGYVIGTLSIDDMQYANSFNDMSDEDILNNIADMYDSNDNYVDLKAMYGGGYSHSNLTPVFKLYNTNTARIMTENDVIEQPELFDYIDENDYNNHILFAYIKAPRIANNINWFFANCNNFDEIFGNFNDDDIMDDMDYTDDVNFD